ncbi:hypothetical protein [Serratia quinivorans]|uniref:hypothetical protein n=1 Tax=Serratia quinivorans TaxID=137545 RepID=UPI0021BD341F|nr:hypothetical protein [Serratia quinivorans]
MRAFSCLQSGRLYAILSRFSARLQSHANKYDHRSSVPPARQKPHEINILPAKTALHRTRLHDLDQEIISVLIFFKPPRQAAPCLGLCEQSQTEKIENNFMFFQFSDRAALRVKSTTY